MQSISDFPGKLVVFLNLLLLVSSGSGGFTKVREKGKTNKLNDIQVNNNYNGNIIRNISQEEGRGFFPPGGLFSIGKVLNFFPVGGERECQPTRGFAVARAGICLNPYDCRQRDGRAAGDCAHGLGVCCVFEVTCGGVVSNNITYFMSPGFPDLWLGEKDCDITIDKVHAGIMQLRIDFVHFNIGQPNRTTGECDEDIMALGSDGDVFKLCGQNHGQHLYYSMPTTTESRDADEIAGTSTTRLSIRPRGPFIPRLWLIRLAQLPLAHSAPHDCLQYFTRNNGTIMTFNYAVNGRHLAQQKYKVCVRRNIGFCTMRYSPCDGRSFRIGPGDNRATTIDQTDQLEGGGPGVGLGPGSGFYGPDGSFVPGSVATNTATIATPATIAADQQVVETENDEVIEDGMMPVNGETQQDEIEGSGDDPQIAAAENTQSLPQPSLLSRIWSFMWPSWLWGQSGASARTWKRWSPYAQHYLHKEEPDHFRYYGYGNFGVGLVGFGRQRCTDRITIPCDNEYFISNTAYGPGVCDPHHCGNAFCPGLQFQDCRVETSVSPFTVSINFGPPAFKRSAEDNIGACLQYTQMRCDS